MLEKCFDYRKQLPNVTAKALVIVGEKDWMCPPKQSEMIASCIPGAHLHVVADANHSVHLEKPELVTKLIREHLDSESTQ